MCISRSARAPKDHAVLDTIPVIFSESYAEWARPILSTLLVFGLRFSIGGLHGIEVVGGHGPVGK